MSRKSRLLEALSQPELPPEEETDEVAERPVRSVHHNKMLDLKAMANRLAALPKAFRRTLPLDDELQTELDALADCPPTPARRRQVMRVKLLVGRLDPVLLEAALNGHTASAERDERAVYWRGRLADGNDHDLQAFLSDFPAADRQSLRAATREARGPQATPRARSRLLQLLREAMAEPAG